MKYCTYCGAENWDKARFCTKCGTELFVPPVAENPAPPSTSAALPAKDEEIKFYCRVCNQPLKAPLEMAGELIDCPICQKPLTIPGSPEAKENIIRIEAPVAEQTPDAEIVSHEHLQEKASNDGNEECHMFCTNCGAKNMGQARFCTTCGTPLVVPSVIEHTAPQSDSRPEEKVAIERRQAEPPVITTQPPPEDDPASSGQMSELKKCGLGLLLGPLAIALALYGINQLAGGLGRHSGVVQDAEFGAKSYGPIMIGFYGILITAKSLWRGIRLLFRMGTSRRIKPPPMPPLLPTPDMPYRGYGGWLSFFCVVQIFVMPIAMVILSVISLSDINALADPYPRLAFMLVVDTIGNLGIVGFGVYAGLLLRRLRPGAVRITKRFLLTALAYSFFSSAIMPQLCGDLPSRVTEFMTNQGEVSFGRTLIGFAIWFSYFKVSKRVKTTFPAG